MQLTVEIISPTESKELNSYGPITVDSTIDRILWTEAEVNRRVFKIVGCQFICEEELFTCHSKGCKAISSTHTAECNLEDLTAIIL